MRTSALDLLDIVVNRGQTYNQPLPGTTPERLDRRKRLDRAEHSRSRKPLRFQDMMLAQAAHKSTPPIRLCLIPQIHPAWFRSYWTRSKSQPIRVRRVSYRPGRLFRLNGLASISPEKPRPVNAFISVSVRSYQCCCLFDAGYWTKHAARALLRPPHGHEHLFLCAGHARRAWPPYTRPLCRFLVA
jgi:hypothetical protein